MVCIIRHSAVRNPSRRSGERGERLPMQIGERSVGDVTILELKGRLVLDDGDDAFRDRIDGLVQSGKRKVLLNLDGVTHIDSAGLGVMVTKYISLHNRGGQLKLCNVHSRTYRVLNDTKLLTVFHL